MNPIGVLDQDLELRGIFEKLDRAQQSLLRAANVVPADLWKTSPRQGAWLAADLIAHVMPMERAVIAATDRILRKHPKYIPLLKRFHLPPALVEKRLLRWKTPIPIETHHLREKDAMLAELREVGERTLAFMQVPGTAT